jgi:uncharacterized coiled-coil protein SlyX
MGDPYYENRIADLESKYELLRWIAEGQVAKLQAELHGTVPGKYHDQIVAEATQLVAKVQAENNKLQAVIERMLPKLREHLPDEYIVYELLEGVER